MCHGFWVSQAVSHIRCTCGIRPLWSSTFIVLFSCTLSSSSAGVVFHYFLLSIALWWFLHVCCMFWKLQFPLHARRHQNKQNYIHAALVALGLLVPIPGIVATLVTSGYTMNHFPPLLCSTKNPNAQYYSLWIEINLLFAVGITLIIVMFWLVHKVFIP